MPHDLEILVRAPHAVLARHPLDAATPLRIDLEPHRAAFPALPSAVRIAGLRVEAENGVIPLGVRGVPAVSARRGQPLPLLADGSVVLIIDEPGRSTAPPNSTDPATVHAPSPATIADHGPLDRPAIIGDLLDALDRAERRYRGIAPKETSIVPCIVPWLRACFDDDAVVDRAELRRRLEDLVVVLTGTGELAHAEALQAFAIDVSETCRRARPDELRRHSASYLQNLYDFHLKRVLERLYAADPASP